ncbi:unnamed protein product [Amoebophrya sp. A25]|nr:unnamed protein product [Amoebophrya sp. A25]|eukprot:GSA25T00017765001.1
MVLCIASTVSPTTCCAATGRRSAASFFLPSLRSSARRTPRTRQIAGLGFSGTRRLSSSSAFADTRSAPSSAASKVHLHQEKTGEQQKVVVEITASSVRRLREITGSSIGECRRALVETGDNINAALDWLKCRNVVAAKTRWEKHLGGNNSATGDSADKMKGVLEHQRQHLPESIVAMATAPSKAGITSCLLRLGAETDFVVRNADFQNTALDLAKQSTEESSSTEKSTEESSSTPSTSTSTSAIVSDKKEHDNCAFKETTDQLSGRVGESVRVLDALILSGEHVFGYVHRVAEKDAQNCGRVGALVSLVVDAVKTADVGACESSQLQREAADVVIAEVGPKIARHVAAMRPRYKVKEDVPADLVESERQICRAQLGAKDLPQKKLAEVVERKMGKFYSQEVLCEQSFLYDENLTVGEYLKARGLRVEEFKLLACS